MPKKPSSFAEAAKAFLRNPLGLIGLFIVFVYAQAGFVTTLFNDLTETERAPLIYFLVLFPVVVLGTFAWLVSRHSSKLFGPRDFRDDASYLEVVRMSAGITAPLVAAKAKVGGDISENEINRVVDAVVEASRPRERQADHEWVRRILWVDDLPENNVYERRAFEALGYKFALALTTDDAMRQLEKSRFAAIISDMARNEGPREGFVLLQRLRAQGDDTPVYFYVGSAIAERKREARELGGQGCTDNPEELFQMVTRGMTDRVVEAAG